MIFHKTDFPGLILIELVPFSDDRGLFSRLYCSREFAEAGLETKFVQDNFSLTWKMGTIRGLHYQKPPHAEVKLVKCQKGSILDVVVDIRKNSPTFLKHYHVELSDRNNLMIYIPHGFAHGFQTLEDESLVFYKHSAFYHPGAEGSLFYQDPKLNIRWPLPVSEISDKDKNIKFMPLDWLGLEF